MTVYEILVIALMILTPLTFTYIFIADLLDYGRDWGYISIGSALIISLTCICLLFVKAVL